MIKLHPPGQVLANPLLFRYLSFDITAASPQLEGLARQVQLQSARGTIVGGYIRSISCLVDVPGAPSSTVRNASYVLLNAPNLRSLVFDGVDIPPSLLAIPLHTSRATVRYLELTVNDEVLFEAQSIGQLQRLEALDMISQADWSTLDGAWTMPNLTKLQWSGWLDDDTGPRCYGDIGFLKKCQLPGLQSLMISIGQTNKPSVCQSKALDEFLQSSLKQSRLFHLGILILPEQYESILPHLAVQSLNLFDSPFEPLIERYLHAAVRVLTLTVTEYNINGFGELLDAICVKRSALRLRRITVATKLDDLPEFRWNLGGMSIVDIPSQAADFVGRLVLVAIRLRACGIELADEYDAQLIA
jgi:hypothetical protein